MTDPNCEQKLPQDELLKTLLRAASSIEERLERAVEEHGLSLAKLGVLRQLAEAGGALSLGQIAERLYCVRSNITQLVDRLEADGLVRREPDPDDRRSTRAVLTAEGRRRLEQALSAHQSATLSALSCLSAEDYSQLQALLVRLGGQHI